MKTTIKIPRREARLTEIIPYLKETLGEIPGPDRPVEGRYNGNGWRFQIKAWREIYGPWKLPDMVYGGDTEPAYYLLDVWDPSHATLISLKFG